MQCLKHVHVLRKVSLQCQNTNHRRKGYNVLRTTCYLLLPTFSLLESPLLHLRRQRPDLQSRHQRSEARRDARKDCGVVPVRSRLYDRTGNARRIAGFEDPRSNKDPFGTETHHEHCIGGRSEASGDESHYGQALHGGNLQDQLLGNALLFEQIF